MLAAIAFVFARRAHDVFVVVTVGGGRGLVPGLLHPRPRRGARPARRRRHRLARRAGRRDHRRARARPLGRAALGDRRAQPDRLGDGGAAHPLGAPPAALALALPIAHFCYHFGHAAAPTLGVRPRPARAGRAQQRARAHAGRAQARAGRARSSAAARASTTSRWRSSRRASRSRSPAAAGGACCRAASGDVLLRMPRRAQGEALAGARASAARPRTTSFSRRWPTGSAPSERKRCQQTATARLSTDGKVRVAIIGVGNCANSLLQGIEYYRDTPGRRDRPRADARQPRRLPHR